MPPCLGASARAALALKSTAAANSRRNPAWDFLGIEAARSQASRPASDLRMFLSWCATAKFLQGYCGFCRWLGASPDPCPAWPDRAGGAANGRFRARETKLASHAAIAIVKGSAQQAPAADMQGAQLTRVGSSSWRLPFHRRMPLLLPCQRILAGAAFFATDQRYSVRCLENEVFRHCKIV